MHIEEICFIGLLLCLGFFIRARKKAANEERFAGEKNLIYRLFSPGVYLLLKFFRQKFSFQIRGDKLEQKRKLYIGKSEEEIFYTYFGKVGCVLAGTVMLGFLLISCSGMLVQKGKLINGYILERGDALGTEKSISLEAKSEETTKEVTITVPRKEYGKKELEKKFAEAKEYINQTYLGGNISAEQIEMSLNLVNAIPDSAISVTWNLGNDGLIDSDGSIRNENIEVSQQIEIIAVLSYGDVEERLVKSITVIPPKRTKEELFWKEWQAQLEKNMDKSASDSFLALPQKIQGKSVSYREPKIQIAYLLLGMLGVLLFLIPILAEENLQKETRRREEELRMSYPDFVEHFVLLIGAGLNIKGAWERIVKDYKKEKGMGKGKFQYVYEEMELSLLEMNNGMSETRAYELFGKRTGLLQYMKFCTLIVQNIKKGSNDLLGLLDYEVADAFRERKENAKALGEKAGTKLLLPMMLMLVIIFVLILYAAFQGM